MPEFHVDEFTGTDDRERLGKAEAQARTAIPSTVLLPARELRLTSHLNVKYGVTVQGVGPESGIFLDYPGAPSPAGNSPYGIWGADLRDFSIRARPIGYYRLIRCQDVSNVELHGITFGVCGQNFIEVRGCKNVNIEDIYAPYKGDNAWDGASAKYGVSLINSEDVHLRGLVMGDSTHDRNQSFVTFNQVVRGSVSDSLFFGTRTYCLNTHGTGSRDIVFSKNTLMPGPNAKFGAILVGNEAWGADGPVYIRDNEMVGPGRFTEIREASLVIFGRNKAPDAEFLSVVKGDAVVVMGG